MIAILEGIIVDKEIGGVVIDVHGVGYDVHASVNDEQNWSQGDKAKIYIYEHIKEDAHDLYGFAHKETKQLFIKLLSVKNVGPKVALAVLDIGSVDAVRSAIANGDVRTLQTAKGVGKRAAEQIVVELRDKVGGLVSDEAERLVNRAAINKRDEALLALVSLGFNELDAQNALADIDSSLPVEQRVKQALKGIK